MFGAVFAYFDAKNHYHTLSLHQATTRCMYIQMPRKKEISPMLTVSVGRDRAGCLISVELVELARREHRPFATR